MKKLLIFISGVAVGSLVTWKYFEEKYRRIAADEIADVKEHFSKRVKPEDDGSIVVPRTKPDISEYVEYARKYESPAVKNSDNVDEPYVISPDEFGQGGIDYDAICLNYFADGVLADDWDNPIEDVEGLVGTDFMNHFGDYEDDIVHIRNDYRKAEFEIAKDDRKFSDVADIDLRLAEDE